MTDAMNDCSVVSRPIRAQVEEMALKALILTGDWNIELKGSRKRPREDSNLRHPV